jgi:hypothetical protein
MPLCGSQRACGCAISSTAATSAEINGDYPTIGVSGAGTGPSPWIMSLDTNWATEVATAVNTFNTQNADLTSFAPSWNNVTVGNGTNTGRWGYYHPQLLYVEADLVFGTTTAVTGGAQLVLPNSETIAAYLGSNIICGQGAFNDTGTTTYVGIVRGTSGGSAVDVMALANSGSYSARATISSTIPMTWTTGDVLSVQALVPVD